MQGVPSEEERPSQQERGKESNVAVETSLHIGTLGTSNENSNMSYSPSSVSDECAGANTRNATTPEEENHLSQDIDACELSDSEFSSSLPVYNKIMHYLKGRTVSHKN